jgi:hypothetical protein
LARGCVGRSVEIREHLLDRDERDFGGALRFGEAPRGGRDGLRTEIRWPGVQTSYTYDGHCMTPAGPAMNNPVTFIGRWTQILHYRRMEELVDVAPAGR